jgi:hypothetical protein
MSVVFQPIFTQTVGAGGVATVTFNNIPQTFTHLRLEIYARTTRATGGNDWDSTRFNGDTATNYSVTYFITSGSTASSSRASSLTSTQLGTFSNATANFPANTFGSATAYILDYTSSNNKQIVSETTTATNVNTTTAVQQVFASLWRNSAAITSISLSSANGANWVQYSTFSLYGILKNGV